MSAEKILLDELAAWYLGDEIDDVTDESFVAEIPERAARSAKHMAKAAGPEGRADVIALLTALRDDREHPLLERIGSQTLIWWNDDDGSWESFQKLANGMIAGLEEMP